MVKIEVQLKLNRYLVDRETHIVVDFEECQRCEHKNCLIICPARCYLPHEERGIEFNHEACLECGSCYLICDHLQWNYPRQGTGICYRFA